MTEENDYLVALKIHQQLNGEDSDVEEVDFKLPPPVKSRRAPVKRSNPHSNLDPEYLNRTQNLVHPDWENLDPTPDIHALFVAFDTKFFQGRLQCVTLEWSKRMYSCAGICYSRSNRFGMDVTIRLSEPLLKLRPRKDLVETMLHEMIHAYCFVLKIREGNGGHGPYFKKIMNGINKVAGTNITVYHTFHDEVDLYKQHWWRCNGSCQNRAPFFGYVKRTSNRAPSSNDQWWASHMESCGGTFMKIKGPEKYPKEKSAKGKKREKMKADVTGGADVRKYFPPLSPKKSTDTINNTNGFGVGSSLRNDGSKGPIKINGGDTMLLNPKTKRPFQATTTAGASSIATAFPPSSYPGISSDPFNTRSSVSSGSVSRGGDLVNVRGLRDLSSNSSLGGGNSGRHISGLKTNTNLEMQGRGYLLSSNSSYVQNATPDGQVDRNHLRNLWIKKFGGEAKGGGSDDTAVGGQEENDDQPKEGDSKRRRTSSNSDYVADVTWFVVDDDIMLHEKPDEVIALSSDSEEDGSDNEDSIATVERPQPVKITADERQNAIKKEIIEETADETLTDDDIVLIDDDYNDDEDLINASAAIELADTSLVDDLFGEDTLLKQFEEENDVVPSGSRHVPNPLNDIITCPICQGKMKRCVFGEHLNGCTGIAVKIVPPKHALKKLSTTSKQLKPTRKSKIPRTSAKDILRKAGYSEQDLANITSASSADEEEEFLNASGITSSPVRTAPLVIDLNSSGECDESTRRYRCRNLYKTTRQCPACAEEIEEDEMSFHLEFCPSRNSSK